MTESYEDTVGRLPTKDPYVESGAIDRTCPPPPKGCGAPAQKKCTFEPQVRQPGGGIARERRYRHHPCIARLSGEEQ
jgi:hypothetical protein